VWRGMCETFRYLIKKSNVDDTSLHRFEIARSNAARFRGTGSGDGSWDHSSHSQDHAAEECVVCAVRLK
jgi:hypothetical protein